MDTESILKALRLYKGKPTPLKIFAKNFFSSTKGSYQKLHRPLIETRLEIERRSQQNLYSLISYLEKQGLIEKSQNHRIINILLTPKGKNRIKEKEKEAAFAARYSKIEGDKNTTIVMFDIPESKRGKRAWLRAVLVNMGFKMVQQSVWTAKKKLPASFLKDLQHFNLLRYVEIFIAQKEGTLKR